MEDLPELMVMVARRSQDKPDEGVMEQPKTRGVAKEDTMYARMVKRAKNRWDR
jgi:hypothetical protein